ncbi:MAG: hypothetical protein ABJC79_11465 [Acidimicrobiia bacterium]
MNIWFLRAIWISLPVTAGGAFVDAIAPWPTAARVVAAMLAWVGWTVVLLATLVPRPVSLTVARFGIPIAFAAAVAVAFTGRTSTLGWVVVVGLTAIACGLGTRGEFARQCVQGAAYGDEERFPLRVPPAVTFPISPVAIAIVGAAVVVGPLLLAHREWGAGIVVMVFTLPASYFVVRLVHQLACRFVVLVPAGMVIADPLTLTDPVLFPRARIMGFGPADPSRRPPEGAVDLRLGASFGSCALLLSDDADIVRRVRNEGITTRTNLLLVTPTAATRLFERARAHRIHVRTD